MYGCIASRIALGLMALAVCATATATNVIHTFNFNGPGASDLGIFRDGRFWYFQGSPANLFSYPAGEAGDVPLPADFDGDGRTDFALYNPSTRTFTWTRSSDGVVNSLTMGNWGDIPVVGDFDGDGKTDLAIYRPSDGLYWYTTSSNNQLVDFPLGEPGDLPVVADFDGDHRDDLAVFNPTTATFSYWQNVTTLLHIQMGQPGDTPVIGDYDGDGKADLGVYHSPTSTFTYRRSSDGQTVSVQFGQHGDTPIVGDFDGDGITDIAVFRPQVGSYNVILYRSSATLQTFSFNFGNPGDMPLGARYTPAERGSGLTYSNLPSAAQTMYQSGVPHTDKNGRHLTTLGSSSFLPRCAVAALPGDLAGLATSGFNCFIPYQGEEIGAPLAEADQAGMQMVQDVELPAGTFITNPNCTAAVNAQNPICTRQAEVARVANDPGILAWKAEDEASGCSSDCARREAVYTGLQTAINQVDSTHPVFNVDYSPPPTAQVPQWSFWNTVSPVASIDNYPFGLGPLSTLADSATDYQALVALNSGRSVPIWIMPQTFSGQVGAFEWTMPTQSQLRAEVFTAVVHGATGIFYFILDNFVARNNGVIGISANPLVSYNGAQPTDRVATPSDIAASQALWAGTVAMNSELQRLQNVILTPTATSSYQVGINGTGVTATPIRTLLKISSTGVYTLLVVNIDNVPLNIQVTLPARPVDLYSIDSGGTRNPATPSGNTIWDSIEGFGIRIYEFK